MLLVFMEVVNELAYKLKWIALWVESEEFANASAALQDALIRGYAAYNPLDVVTLYLAKLAHRASGSSHSHGVFADKIRVRMLASMVAVASAPTANSTIRSMPFGDSITEIICWRSKLWNKLQGTEWATVNFVSLKLT
ncbi:hypothetical protein IQ07DRAFT_642497 [Pyrenochaeta sp. DS3sAY3a]|nr:hypothetical protein IQ07DRAFT_642497 [Pyrenochaeta sp. DS3sAY3a]